MDQTTTGQTNTNSSTSPVTPVTNATNSTYASTAGAGGSPDMSASSHAEEAKSRFNAALEEAKAGASALKDEAVTRASSYREQAKSTASSYRDQARNTGDSWNADVRLKANELAVEGKARASGALAGLSRLVEENAAKIDENFGPQYGDYARTASRSIRDTADTLDRKSIDELENDARTFIREQPGTAVGMAAVAGFLVARMFRK